MKKTLFLIIFILFIALPVHAVNIKEWNVDVLIEEESSLWTVVLRYEENTTKSDYFVLGSITDVDVIADELPIKCMVTERVGTSIVCDNINARKMTYKFRLLQSPSEFSEPNIFNYRIRTSITQITSKFSMTVKLPLGAAIVEKSKLEGSGLQRFEPGWGTEGTDGRRIFVQWVINEPKLGETYDFSVVYEKLIPEQEFPFAPIVGLLLIVIAIGAILYLRRPDMREVLPVLTEGERKVVEILLREKKEVDQRLIVKELDYSKSKVSRIVKTLMERGLVEKTPKGRTNLLRLRKPSKMTEKSEKSQ